MSKEATCGRCGEAAQGYAYIDQQRYCHGEQEKPTCYMKSSWEATSGQWAHHAFVIERKASA